MYYLMFMIPYVMEFLMGVNIRELMLYHVFMRITLVTGDEVFKKRSLCSG